MACPSGMDIETAFIVALAQVKTWRIVGRVLELLDVRNQVIARFEAPGRDSARIVGAPCAIAGAATES